MPRKTLETLTPAEVSLALRVNKIHGEAIQQACDRATARGLTDEELQREVDDEDSVFWEDVDAIFTDLIPSALVS